MTQPHRTRPRVLTPARERDRSAIPPTSHRFIDLELAQEGHPAIPIRQVQPQIADASHDPLRSARAAKPLPTVWEEAGEPLVRDLLRPRFRPPTPPRLIPGVPRLHSRQPVRGRCPIKRTLPGPANSCVPLYRQPGSARSLVSGTMSACSQYV